MAPSTALGESVWEKHGGTVVRCKHPSGRITFTYVSPQGDKLRSWKQCLSYMGEDSPGSSASELKKSKFSKSSRNCNLPSSRADSEQHNGSIKKSPFTSSGIEHGPRKEEKGDSRPILRQEAEKARASENVLLNSKTGMSAIPSPDTTAGRHRRLDCPSDRKVISPSTFIGDKMPGKAARGKERPVIGAETRHAVLSCASHLVDSKLDAPVEHNFGKKDKELEVAETRKGAKFEQLCSISAQVKSKVVPPGLILELEDPSAHDGKKRSRYETQCAHGSTDEVEDMGIHASIANGISEEAGGPWTSGLSYSSDAVPASSRKRAHDFRSDAEFHNKKRREESESDSDFETSDSDKYERSSMRKDLSNRPRRAAAGTNFKEKKITLDERNALIGIKEEKTVEGEDVAIVLTANADESQTPQDQFPNRSLIEFVVHDEDGTHRPVEAMDACTLFITGLVLPNIGVLDKEKGVRCEWLGPIISWSIMGYEKSSPTLVFSTDLAEYYCVKPAAAYKKLYNILFDKAKVCVEVYRSLSKPEGGNPFLNLDELIARMTRSFSKQGGSGHFFNREFVINHAKFVVGQLTALDELASDKEQLFSGLPALDALEHEGSKLSSVIAHQAFGDGSSKIQEGTSYAYGGAPSGTDLMSDSMRMDENLARLLQEEVDRANFRPTRRAPAARGKYYIKINETEIANDYPLPEFYKSEEEEVDEYIIFDGISIAEPEELPLRKLHDWALYNSDSRLVSLELLPMLRGAETDMEIFGSGIITEDDGSGFCLDGDGAAVGCREEPNSMTNGQEQGMRVYLSAVKEWKIEFGASMLFMSFRTDGAWYRLGRPTAQYVRWYQPVLKTAKLAVSIITMLKEELRVNRLSLNDVIKKLTDQKKDEATYISAKAADVERYVIVHGQIILQLFAEYPEEAIKRSAFITGLATKMEQVSHTKLTLRKRNILKKERNLNPRANLCPDGNKRKPMRATTTRLVDRIWSAFYAGTGEPQDSSAEKDEVVEEDPLEESDDDETVLEAKPSLRDTPKTKSKYWRASAADTQWGDETSTRTANNERVYKKAIVRGMELSSGKVVLVKLNEGSGHLECSSVLVLIEYLYDTRREGPMLHGRVLLRGSDTILGNAANEREVFLTDNCKDVEVEKTDRLVAVELRQRPWGHKYRNENAARDQDNMSSAKDKEGKGVIQEYFCKSWYSPERGAFFTLPVESLALGLGTCKACESRRETEERLEVQIFGSDQGFRFQGVQYHINDYLYLDPDTFEREAHLPAVKNQFKGGRNKGLAAFAVCQLLNVLPLPNGNGRKASRLMKVRRFYRPEDVDKLKGYKADICEVYYSEETSIVDIATARGKCVVRREFHDVAASETFAVNHVFFCSCIHDPKTGTIKQLPASIKLCPRSSLESTTGNSQAKKIAAIAKAKGKATDRLSAFEQVSESTLSTLDIFAGCGGLSEGLHQSGSTMTKWAIEYDYPAAEAFKSNHPTADVFCENCNVILRCIMEIGGDLDDCISPPEADVLSRELDEERKRRLPKPGEVDFISGGPPCQGFSGMNRFNQRAWSKVQCEMILSFLSYVDYFRPRYFLLENVRNFVSFNKGQTFRLTLATLLEMGYQVRFGVLQAGNYGVAQSRKRAFIWAAGPTETLPEWPEPRHVFSSSQLGVPFPGGFQYAAVRDAGRGAPLRAITVRDTLGDLPAVENGASNEVMPYTGRPESWFQVQIRGEETRLVDHISKEMNELNVIRCRQIPKEPGADWRALRDEKVTLSTGQVVDLIPWCLPNTADRHNQWKGLFGRLDWDGNFPTSITDPQPMGKVGMCFHPEQDRIVTVRECARSQVHKFIILACKLFGDPYIKGFPDRYKFFGNINNKHRQIGNAVPPPLARALGHMLKEAISRKIACLKGET